MAGTMFLRVDNVAKELEVSKAYACQKKLYMIKYIFDRQFGEIKVKNRS